MYNDIYIYILYYILYMSQFLLHAEILRYKRREKTVWDLDTLEGRLCLHSICRSLRLSFSKAWSSILVLRWSHEGAEVQRERSESSFIIIMIVYWRYFRIFHADICICICICSRYYVLCIMYMYMYYVYVLCVCMYIYILLNSLMLASGLPVASKHSSPRLIWLFPVFWDGARHYQTWYYRSPRNYMSHKVGHRVRRYYC